MNYWPEAAIGRPPEWDEQCTVRLPPSNVPAEQALLGAILTNNRAYEYVADYLRPEHFADPVHGTIYDSIQKIVESGRIADAVTLKTYLEGDDRLEEVGGTSYLVKLLSAMIAIINAGDYGRVIFQTWQRREAIDACQKAINAAYDPKTNLPSILSDAASSIDTVLTSDVHRRSTWLADAMGAAMDAGARAAKGEGFSGVTTGSPNLDNLFGDLVAGGVYILAGRPGSGKSALALQIACHNADREVPVFYASTEMEATQLGRRALAHKASVSSQSIKSGCWNADEGKLLSEAYISTRKIQKFFLIEDSPGLNTRVIGARARSFARAHKGKIGLVVIDHMHDLSELSEKEMIRGVGEICRGAKSIGKQLGWPVIMLAQMNRAIDSRETKRPDMSDLYGGMQIEAVAEGIILLDRPETRLDPAAPEQNRGETDEKYTARWRQWQAEWDKWRNITQGHIPKNRDGSRGVVTWKFRGASGRFDDTTAPGGCH